MLEKAAKKFVKAGMDLNEEKNGDRERFATRIGFILISAGCAIGLGNIWRFPYVVAENGGAAFLLFYFLFLIILGIPLVTMEFAVGRASRKSIAKSFLTLEPKGTKWHYFSLLGIVGNYMLMMFYTGVSGWILLYVLKTLHGDFLGLDSAGVATEFGKMVAEPTLQSVCMAVMVIASFAVCSLGLRDGVERITKVVMALLLLIMFVLAGNSLMLPGAAAGVEYFFKPDFARLFSGGWGGFNEVLFAAMGQAFFTLSIGIGSMAIFGSYIGRERSLLGESVHIAVLDTLVAITAGLIIIPACFAFNVELTAGPALIFIALPNIFNSMAFGQAWGVVFFLFMLFAAMSSLIAVFENILSFAMDYWGWSRQKSVWINCALIIILSLPALFGNNIWQDVQPLGKGSTILDFEDFIVSQNALPIGALAYVFFCTWKIGWGWDGFFKESNMGRGMRVTKNMRFYLTWILPLIILYVFIMGYVGIFSK
jgi:NSS family neurotransmitter:Na+ symporter